MHFAQAAGVAFLSKPPIEYLIRQLLNPPA